MSLSTLCQPRYVLFLELSCLYLSRQQPDHKTEWLAFLPSLVTRLRDAIEVSSGEKATLNSAQLKMVMKLGFKALRLTQHQAPQQFHITWKPDPWISIKSKLDNCKRFEGNVGLLQIYEQMITAMTSPSSGPKHKKRKLPDIQPLPEAQEKKRKKTKENVSVKP